MAEKILWRFIRNNQIGYKFHRQYAILGFFADFYCNPLKLVIELDGETHNSEKSKTRDNWRQGILEKAGYKVIRFINEEIYGDIESVLEKIISACKVRERELKAST